MKRLWTRWVGFVDARDNGISLALVRILVGLTIAMVLVEVVATDVVGLIWYPASEGGYRRINTGWWLYEVVGYTPGLVDGLVWVGIVLSLALVLGALPGPAIPLLLSQVLLALFSLNTQSGGGHDRVLTCTLFVLIFARHSAVLSLWARLRTGRLLPEVSVPDWPRWVLLFQLCLIYTSTGVQKVGSDWMPWGDFAAIYYALQLPEWARFDHSWAAHPLGYLFTQIGTATTWLFETTAFVWLVAVWFAETRDRPGRLRALSNRLHLREGYAIVGFLLHLGIFVTMNVGPFSPAMVALYPCAFSGESYARLREALAGGALAGDGSP